MQLPQVQTIQSITAFTNNLLAGHKLQTDIKDDYCSLVPVDSNGDELLSLLRKVRNEYKKIYFWVDSVTENEKERSTLNFSQKY